MVHGVRVNGCFRLKQESTFLDTCQVFRYLSGKISSYRGGKCLVLEHINVWDGFLTAFYSSRSKIN